jgi:hypothetical protein
MNKFVTITISTALCCIPHTSYGDFFCKDKKSGVVSLRKTACKGKETAVAPAAITYNATAAVPKDVNAAEVIVRNTGAVASGTDLSTGLDISVTRTGAVGGSIGNTGMNLSVVGDGGGDSTNVGLYVSTSGADANYCAIFQGGNVGIGINDPDEALEIAGRLHLGQSSAPTVATDKLYNIGGALYWAGQAVSLGSQSSGTITGVTAGTGLVGGGTSGVVALSINTGTSANSIVQLNGSAELPAISGVNLSQLNASALATGSVSDSRLSSNVSLLGSSIGLASEVNGTLPIANGGTGVTTLSDLIALSTHTTGDYVASVNSSGGITGGAAGSEGAALTLSVDQTFSPTWSGTHSFTQSANFGTTTASAEALHLNGRMHLEQSSAPSVTTDKLYNVGGSLFFAGKNLTAEAAGGDVTGVTAGTGLTGGGDSGSVTLNVDVGTGANDIVQLNSSAQLPAVSGFNLTNIQAGNIATGTLAEARLPGTVSLLGSSISLTTEVSGTLPIANGGTGATSLSNLLTLGTHTVGNYVAVASAGTGIAVASSGAEGGTATISLDQAVTPTWTGSHTYSGVATDITTVSQENFCIVPNGTGKVGLGTTSPSAMLDAVYTSTSITAGSEAASEFSITDTGIVTSGTDTTRGAVVTVSRTGPSGGIINSTGLDVAVTGDTGGTSTATGINVAVSGADTNYAALFSGGYVGIGTTTPTALLDTVYSSASTDVASEMAARLYMTDTGVVTAGSDITTASLIDLRRTGATGGTITSTALEVSALGDTGGTSTAIGMRVSASGADTNYAALFSSGRVGIGTATPSALFETSYSSVATSAATEIANSLNVVDSGVVNSGSDVTYGLQVNTSRTGASGGTINSIGVNINAVGSSGGTSTVTGLDVAVSGADTNIAANFSGGSVALGALGGQVTSANIPTGSLVIDNGALCVDDGGNNCDDGALTQGTIYAEATGVTGIDLAENFPVEDGAGVELADIVMIDTKSAPTCSAWSDLPGEEPSCSSEVLAAVPFVAKSQGDSRLKKRVIGVVSTKPGYLLGGMGHRELAGYKKVAVALAGRIPLKISLENGPLEIGDRIVPSSTPGVGMKANEGEVYPVAIALESYTEEDTQSRDRILALVK